MLMVNFQKWLISGFASCPPKPPRRKRWRRYNHCSFWCSIALVSKFSFVSALFEKLSSKNQNWYPLALQIVWKNKYEFIRKVREYVKKIHFWSGLDDFWAKKPNTILYRIRKNSFLLHENCKEAIFFLQFLSIWVENIFF